MKNITKFWKKHNVGKSVLTNEMANQLSTPVTEFNWLASQKTISWRKIMLRTAKQNSNIRTKNKTNKYAKTKDKTPMNKCTQKF